MSAVQPVHWHTKRYTWFVFAVGLSPWLIPKWKGHQLQAVGYQCTDSDDAFRNSSKILVKLVKFCDWYLAQGHASCSSLDYAYDTTGHCILLVPVVCSQYWKIQDRKVLCLFESDQVPTHICLLYSYIWTGLYLQYRDIMLGKRDPTFYMPVTDMITSHMEKGLQICNFNIQITALCWQMSRWKCAAESFLLQLCCFQPGLKTVRLSQNRYYNS